MDFRNALWQFWKAVRTPLATAIAALIGSLIGG